MSELADLFHSEATEYLQLLNDSLLALEKTEDEAETREHLDEMFRAAHSLKGMSATMGYNSLARLTHRMEDLLDQVRAGAVRLTPAIADLLFEGLDALEAMLANPEEAEADEDLMERYTRYIEGAGDAGDPEGAGDAGDPEGAGPAAAGSGFPPLGPSSPSPASSPSLPSGQGGAALGFEPGYRLRIAMAPEAPMKSVRGHVVLRALENEERIRVVSYHPDPLEDNDDAFEGGMEVLVRTDLPAEEVVERLMGVPDVTEVDWEPWAPSQTGAGAEEPVPAAADAAADAPAGAPAGTPSGSGPGAPSALPAAAPPGAPDDSPGAAAAAKTATAQRPAASRPGTGAPSAPASGAARRGNGRQASLTQMADRIVRVDTEQLDALVNLVGELVIYRVRLLEVTAEARRENPSLSETVEHVDRITDNLQHAIMSLRMVPVSQVFNRFPRVVRDIARQLGKQVEFITQGEETELDRSIVHQLSDPLVHLIRNAVDHGLESPEERIRLGKPPVGRVELTARHQGNHVVIEVADDGRGIDPERITAIALKRGVITQEEAEMLTPAQKLQLIFRPGFSTAEEVTDVSGRGVGMDAVRTVLESLNGQVDMHSEPGRGTRVILRLPLTLAIIPALLVRCGTEVYALPLEYVMQNLRLSPQEIHTIQGYPHIRWRDSVLGVRSLAQLMRLPPDRLLGSGNGSAIGHAEGQANRPAVVIDVGNRQAVLEVDEILGQQEIVIKNLGSLVGEIKGVAGATVLGDGRVALIVDLPAFIEE